MLPSHLSPSGSQTLQASDHSLEDPATRVPLGLPGLWTGSSHLTWELVRSSQTCSNQNLHFKPEAQVVLALRKVRSTPPCFAWKQMWHQQLSPDTQPRVLQALCPARAGLPPGLTQYPQCSRRHSCLSSQWWLVHFRWHLPSDSPRCFQPAFPAGVVGLKTGTRQRLPAGI